MTTKAIVDVITERKRQIIAEGWETEHDDIHTNKELVMAAISYAIRHGTQTWHNVIPHYSADATPPMTWPWHSKWWKPKNPRRDLVRAAALLIAEIERLDRRDSATVDDSPAAADKA